MKNNTFGWDRRLFVGGAAVVAIASCYIGAIGYGALKKCNDLDIEAGLPSDLQSLIRIGNSYLNEHTKNGKLDPLDEVVFDETELRLNQYRLRRPTSFAGDKSTSPRRLRAM